MTLEFVAMHVKDPQLSFETIGHRDMVAGSHDVYRLLIERVKIYYHFLVCFDLDFSKYSSLMIRFHYQCEKLTVCY